MNIFQRKEGIQFTKEPFIEDVGPRKIESIKFSKFTENDIFNAAEVQVYRGLYYDNKKKPIENGLLDPRMGPPNKISTCGTCHGNFTSCPGHYGYLPLALPVYNVGYLATIVDLLKCICKSCARVLLPEKERVDFLKKMRNPSMESLRKTELFKRIVKRCNSMASSSKAVKCSRCGYVDGMVKKAAGRLEIIHERSNIIAKDLEAFRAAISHTREAKGSIKMNLILNPEKVLSLFKRMLDEDCELLYLSGRPESLLITSIAVPPLAIRPSVFVDGGTQSNESDITQRLRHIIEANASLQQELSETTAPYRSLLKWVDLQAEVALYINSDAPVMKNDISQKVLSGLVQRLKGKQGRFRGNLSGKRVEYTGRTVISPDPNLKITEVGIPIHMARILTYPEQVTHHNIEKLRLCVRNGPDKYPGARFIAEPNGDLIFLKFASVRKRLADDLKFGVKVHRHLEDGDIVLFNRQPSLHRMSIMSHRARIMQWRTLRFNESVCNPYNADFDGDEMNMHVPQTEEARTEALLLMGVQNNLCTPKNGEILVAPTQDFLTSSFLITRKDTFYDRATFCLICCYMGDGIDHIDLPTPALIKPIELWTGKQLFNVLLRPHSGVRVYLNFTLKEKGYKKKETRETMCPNDSFVYFRNSELISGQLGKPTLGNGNKDGLYSVLLRDYGSHAAAVCMNRLAKLSARWIGNHGFSIGIDDVQPGVSLNKNKKATVLEGYGQCDELIQSYSKGELQLQPGCDAAQTLEIQMTGVLNNIREKAADVCYEELHWRNSVKIMLSCGSKGSSANMSQMIACVGQQSVGGKRAPDGFIDRSLPHFPTKSKLPAAKGFVANSFYSGLTPTEFFFHTMGGREGLVDTAVKTADTGYMSRRLIKALEDLSVQYDNTVRNASACIVQFVYGDDGMDPSLMEAPKGKPLNFGRLLLKTKATCPTGEEASLSPSDIKKVCIERLQMSDMTEDGGCSRAFKDSLNKFVLDCCEKIRSTRTNLKLNEDKQLSGCKLLENVAQNISGLTATQLKVFLETCISRYHLKKVECGTAIGAIGAQSIGEPGTQMTLKTFHFAGVASMNVTQGVPRIKEIINAAKKISTPFITAQLECDNNKESGEVVQSRVEKTTLGQVAKSVKSVISSRNACIKITLDMETSSRLSINADTVKEAILRTPRIKLKKEHINVLDARKLEVIPPADKSNLIFRLEDLKKKLPKVVVKGINTVERAVIAEQNNNERDEGNTKKEEKYEMLVEGTGLLAVMGTEGVKGCNTVSNHIMEVKDVIGIEAARDCIIKQIQLTMTSHGMSIDDRHMMLLADVMTFKGEVLGITRHGIQKMKESVLMLASFEKTSDHLFNASVNGREDKIEGVSECIIMGIPMKLGTGILKVRQRVDEVQPLKYGPDPIIQ